MGVESVDRCLAAEPIWLMTGAKELGGSAEDVSFFVSTARIE